MNKAVHYEIRVAGNLSGRYADWFEGLSFRHEVYRDEAVTVLSGLLPDQTALHGVLSRLSMLSLPLLSVNTVKPDEPQGS